MTYDNHKMNKVYITMVNREIILYVFFGGCTTFVNLFIYFLLRSITSWNYNLENIVSSIIAIIFAYYVNSRFVFQRKICGFVQHLSEFLKFMSARIITIFIEVVGLWLTVTIMHVHDGIAKLSIQFFVIIFNYIISKFFIFVSKENHN